MAVGYQISPRGKSQVHKVSSPEIDAWSRHVDELRCERIGAAYFALVNECSSAEAAAGLLVSVCADGDSP